MKTGAGKEWKAVRLQRDANILEIRPLLAAAHQARVRRTQKTQKQCIDARRRLYACSGIYLSFVRWCI